MPEFLGPELTEEQWKSLQSSFPEPNNIVLRMGEGLGGFKFHFICERTITNRIKYWLFCKFFPFTVEEWD